MVGFTDFNDKNKCITREDINKITGFNPINVLFYQQAFIHNIMEVYYNLLRNNL